MHFEVRMLCRLQQHTTYHTTQTNNIIDLSIFNFHFEKFQIEITKRLGIIIEDPMCTTRTSIIHRSTWMGRKTATKRCDGGDR